MIPPGVLQRVEAALGPVRRITPVGGGCINPVARIDLEGTTVFLKWNLDASTGLFAAEANGLRKLRAATRLRVPAVLDAWAEGLPLEWLEFVPDRPEFHQQLGRGLVALHRASMRRSTRPTQKFGPCSPATATPGALSTSCTRC